MIVSFVTIACLAILVLELLFVIVNVLLKKRSQRIAFLRSFKKGKCAIIYLTAIPLYCIGHLDAGKDFLRAFFDAVNKIINLVVLKYDVSSISGLMAKDQLYSFTIYFCFVLVGLNALLFTFSLTSQHIWCAVQALKATVTRKDKLFLFGNNPQNIWIYQSDTKRNRTVIDDISDKECERLYREKISFVSVHSFDNALRTLFGQIRKNDREYVLVINTGSDEKNMMLCRTVINEINATPDERKERLFLQLKVFVFGDPRYTTIYEDIVSSASGCIHYINKYQKIAMDFIDRYPLTKFMDETQIDYETSLIRPDVDINVFLIGFGKTNQQIFLTSVANNQFLTAEKGEPTVKKVKYLIFDRDNAENNKNLNHSYYRYSHECSDLDPEQYLPLPSLPAEEKYFRLDVNDCGFYDQIREIASRSKKDANFIVIAFGSDLENIDMAQKLVEKRKEWGLENLVIFVKARTWHKEETLLEEESCFFIANERDVVYDIDSITGDKIFHMAQMRNEVYDLEYSITHEPDVVVDDAYTEKNHAKATRRWYVSKSQMERDSSLYCCLSLRFKLNLMGLDYCVENEGVKGLTEAEYLAVYAGKDLPDTTKYKVSAKGKKIVAYTLEFADSRRKNMAILEHQRWNAFMISRGMIPASISQIVDETAINEEGETYYTNGKNYAVRRHGNLTTFEGLIVFRKIIALRDQTTEETKDVIKYDYQLLDDAYWLLSENGYQIIPHTKLS